MTANGKLYELWQIGYFISVKPQLSLRGQQIMNLIFSLPLLIQNVSKPFIDRLILLFIYPNSFTALEAISIAIFIFACAPESELAMVIRPNGCLPIFTESPGPLTV